MNNEQNQGQISTDAEDMFAEIDSGSAGNVAPPIRPVNMGNPVFTQQAAAGSNMSQAAMNRTPDGRHDKGDVKYLIIGIVSLAVVLLAAWFVYKNILQPRYLTPVETVDTAMPAVDYNAAVDEVPVNANVINSLEITAENTPLISEAATINNETANNEIANPINTDTDGDGLIDTDEITRGTNINLVDTDSDGLSDGEEVNIWETNPLESDTDGDSYSDGQEVEGKYNPNGPGKLYEVKAQ
jgi:hypothetical protein